MFLQWIVRGINPINASSLPFQFNNMGLHKALIFRCRAWISICWSVRVGSTYCSELNHKSNLGRLCTLNQHISHIASLGMHGRLRHQSTVSRLNANGREGKWILIRREANENLWCFLNRPNSSCYKGKSTDVKCE